MSMRDKGGGMRVIGGGVRGVWGYQTPVDAY